MPENSDGGDNPPSSGQTSCRSNNRGRRNTTPRESRFKGECEALKGSVYDVTAGKDTFLKTTHKIAEYVGRVLYNDAGEYRLAMINLSLAALVEPPLPADGAGMMIIEIWKIERRNYQKKIEACGRNEQQIYSLILGQCSEALLSCVRVCDNFSTADTESNVTTSNSET